MRLTFMIIMLFAFDCHAVAHVRADLLLRGHTYTLDFSSPSDIDVVEGTLLYSPNTESSAPIYFAFARRNISEDFIRTIFLDGSNGHPWREPGVGMIVTEDQFVVRLDPGTAFLVAGHSKFHETVFSSGNAMGRIIKACGSVFHVRLTSAEIAEFGVPLAEHFPRDDYDSLYSLNEQPDGSYSGNAPALRSVDLAKNYAPVKVASNLLAQRLEAVHCFESKDQRGGSKGSESLIFPAGRL